ncbi:MAG: hypothetical protein NC122_03425 [Faecalibacterium sp.]|nr:hypothetical protein [Ruminococcus sp.]MCM1391449.1 hypothetical protein [Ruminococcus sp.]MCM1485236.1 hypothetical protein [Faecalibacterium sp.]
MVYIEFFDNDAIENICSSIAASPDKVYLLGNNGKQLNVHAERYHNLFLGKGAEIDFIPMLVNKNSLSDLVSVLSKIVETESECCFDLTGGEDLCLVAMGIVFEKYPEKNIQMHRFNIGNNTLLDCDGDGNKILSSPEMNLSVVENIKAFGGDVVFEDTKENGTYGWILTDSFKRDVETMWEIICSGTNPGAWNTQINVFEVAEAYCCDDNDLTTVAPLKELKENLKNLKEKKPYVYIHNIINQLAKYGLAYVNENETTLSIEYKNPQVKKCLTKAGQVLELIVYLRALAATDKNGNAVYSDVMTGVYIDWDGEIHTDDGGYDTENEIDVMMMHNLVPVFVSCKNGEIKMEELYKLNTVANRFGGKYAKKILVASALGFNDAAKYLRQRAKDMNINIIEPIGMKESAFIKALGNAWHG